MMTGPEYVTEAMLRDELRTALERIPKLEAVIREFIEAEKKYAQGHSISREFDSAINSAREAGIE